MPTSKEETLYIAEILDKAIPTWKALFIEDVDEIKANLTKDLAEKIGFATDNYSVRKSLFDLCRHYNPDWKIPENIIANLIDEFHKKKRDLEIDIYEFVGMDLDEWSLHCQEKYQTF